MLDQYSKWNDSDITFRIFIADVSEDTNLSGHDSYFLNHVMIKRPHLNALVSRIRRALSISQFITQPFCTQYIKI